MRKTFFVIVLFACCTAAFSQTGYVASLKKFRTNYVQTHEVVTGNDRNAMRFFPVDAAYRVAATFTKATESQWLNFPTSGTITKVYKVYGTARFTLHGKTLQLNLYQSQDLLQNEQYKNYLFLPFTDSTTGSESYDGGRYIDIETTDIKNGKLAIDFNKAYNPYCAYVSGKYNCPLPPKENALPIAIRAGEKAYAKPH